MKKILFFTITMFVLVFEMNAQSDTMYVMKNGAVVGKYSVNTQVDSIIFYDPTRGTFTDTRDGNTYKWVKIGNQVWMAENLKYLPNVVGPGTGSETTPCYYVYGNNGTNVTNAKTASNYINYGVLYNWPAAMAGSASSNVNPSGARGVCPTGWHLPSDAEWVQLINFLGGTGYAGGKLKEIGIVHWGGSNTGATNETNFTALPGGYRYLMQPGAFYEIGNYGTWWSATQEGPYNAWYRYMTYNDRGVVRMNDNKEMGFSVRCVRD